MTRFHVTVDVSMSRRQNASTSALVIAPGSSVVMPSLASRARIDGSKARLPSRSCGQSLSRRKEVEAVFSWKMRASIAAAKRLFAAVIAWMSPVMCRLNSSIGAHCE